MDDVTLKDLEAIAESKGWIYEYDNETLIFDARQDEFDKMFTFTAVNTPRGLNITAHSKVKPRDWPVIADTISRHLLSRHRYMFAKWVLVQGEFALVTDPPIHTEERLALVVEGLLNEVVILSQALRVAEESFVASFTSAEIPVGKYPYHA